MAIRDDVTAALTRARETMQLTRLLARQMSVRKQRDTLLLEAVALEAVVKRIEGTLETADPADLGELMDEIERAAATIRSPADYMDS